MQSSLEKLGKGAFTGAHQEHRSYPGCSIPTSSISYVLDWIFFCRLGACYMMTVWLVVTFHLDLHINFGLTRGRITGLLEQKSSKLRHRKRLFDYCDGVHPTYLLQLAALSLSKVKGP